jgi:hypothetical protein
MPLYPVSIIFDRFYHSTLYAQTWRKISGAMDKGSALDAGPFLTI